MNEIEELLEEALAYKADYAYVFMCEKIAQVLVKLRKKPEPIKWTVFIEHLELNQKRYCLEHDDHRIANITEEQFRSFERLLRTEPKLKLHPNKKGREDCGECPYPERYCGNCINKASEQSPAGECKKSRNDLILENMKLQVLLDRSEARLKAMYAGDCQKKLKELEQLPAGDFTKNIRANLKRWKYILDKIDDIRVRTVLAWLKESLKLIDLLKEDHKRLKEQKENLTLQLLAIDHYCRVNDIDIEEALKEVEKPK